MSHINEKLGLKPAGQRAMMKFHKALTRAEIARITSARCPSCQRTGARQSRTKPGALYCPWCNTTFELPE